MRHRYALLALAVAPLAAACGEEDPVGLEGLLPESAVRTVEVVLEAPQFLEWDSVRAGWTRPANAGYLVVAEDFGGALDAHGLVRFAPAPTRVVYDSSGTSRTDTMPTFVGGQVVVRVDTTRTLATAPVRLALFRVAEPWDPGSATWALRVDSGAVETPWSQPGGTVGALVDTLTFAPGDSLLSFDVDSQTIALWSDTDDESRGALIVAETPGARLRFTTLRLHLQARPSARPDTVVTDSVNAVASTYVYDPPATPNGALLVGGIQGWRSFLRFRDRLDTLTFDCPGGPPGCRLRLSEASLNFAALQLQPVDPPPGFVIADTLGVDVRSVFDAPGVPLVRRPLTERLALPTPIAPTLFSDASGAARVEIPITGLVRSFLREPDEDETPPIRTIGLLEVLEGAFFGTGSFGAAGSGTPPRLRLILSVTSEVQLR